MTLWLRNEHIIVCCLRSNDGHFFRSGSVDTVDMMHPSAEPSNLRVSYWSEVLNVQALRLSWLCSGFAVRH